MNDQQSFEREIAAWLADELPGSSSDRLAHQILSSAGRTRQRPHWLALIKEPPMRISSSLAVGSSTVRVVAIVVATLLVALMVAGAGIAGSRLLAADGDIVVDPDGDGTTTTITAALAMADDGDTILVRPGTYAEVIVIDKDVTLTGDGDRDEVIVALPDGVFPGLTIADSDAVLSNLTLTGPESQVLVSGGAPTLEGILFDRVAIPYTGGVGNEFRSLMLDDGARALVKGNTFVGGGDIHVRGGSAPIIEGNELATGPGIYMPLAGEGTVIRANTISGTAVAGIQIDAAGPTTIEGNTIDDAGQHGIMDKASGAGLIISDNTISGSTAGVTVSSGAHPTIEGNRIADNQTGIFLAGSDALVRGNTIAGGDVGIVLASGGSPTLSGNTVEGASLRGIVILRGANPTLAGNTICGNATNLFVHEDAEPVSSDGNEICEDEPAEASE